MSAAEFDDDLFDMVSELSGPGTFILTLSTKLHRITAVDRLGVLVDTERSMSLGTGPQPVYVCVQRIKSVRQNHPSHRNNAAKGVSQ
ncbi:hypothetical protein ACWDUN_00725 [Mycobacterium sp. NPDC003323]